MGSSAQLTSIFDVVPGPVQDLQGARKVQRVKARIEGKEDLHGRSWAVSSVSDCTHLAGDMANLIW